MWRRLPPRRTKHRTPGTPRRSRAAADRSELHSSHNDDRARSPTPRSQQQGPPMKTLPVRAPIPGTVSSALPPAGSVPICRLSGLRVTPRRMAGRRRGAADCATIHPNGLPARARVREPDRRENTMSKQTFVIVGASLAGAKAAEELRDRGLRRARRADRLRARAAVRAAAADQGLPARGVRAREGLRPRAGFYEQHEIELLAGSTATAIDPALARVLLEDGQTLATTGCC